MSAKPRRANHAPRREHMIAALVVVTLIAVSIAAAFRATAEESVAVTPRPAPTSILIPSPMPWPVTPQVCRDAIQAARNAYDISLEADEATTRSSELLRQGVAQNSLKKLNEAKKANREAARLVRAVERARGQFDQKAKACERT